ncbi:AMP-binding protein [Kitasatospora sp. NPDC002965]|uniref:AMP-binding protein n=1 Tax=Kitasatospora sp. NPDC002965 TaxID=3154775 RepID=UPI0033BBA4BC
MNRTLHAAVARRALLTPDRPALVEPGTTVTYRTLDRAADHLASLLTDLGIGPGSLVPVILPRSARLVIVQLALLKCGAAYSVLDPGWPPARLASLVGRLRSPLAVADEAVAARAVTDLARAQDPGPEGPGPTDGHGFPVWTPPLEPPAELADRAGAPVRRAADGESPAMVIFTSGTTGSPKAVVLPHRAALRLFDGTGPASFGPGHVMPQVSNAAWDMYALEVWGTLVAGGTCLLPGPGAPLFLPDSLRAAVAGHGAGTVHLPTSLFNLFVDVDPGCFTGLRAVLVSGEAMSGAHAGRFVRAHLTVPLVNCYGPVECCMFVSWHRVSLPDCDRPDGVPLGTAAPGTRLLVLADTGADAGADGDGFGDGFGEICPPGKEGEICVAGEGLAHGYLGQAGLTAEKFRTLTVDGVPTRVYRTGDRGRVDDDGLLHYLGRGDRQVKLRGYRVEPAEVERAGRAVPGVLDCAAVPVREADGSCQSLLLAYTVRPDEEADRAAGSADPLGVRAALAAVLPEFLVPARAVAVAALPLTPNGKLDRAALEDWGRTQNRRNNHG